MMFKSRFKKEKKRNGNYANYVLYCLWLFLYGQINLATQN